MMTGLGMGFGFFGVFFMLLFWGGLIALAVWLVWAMFNRTPQSAHFLASEGATAQQILDTRYARGEITKDQYELMKLDLSGK